MAASGRPLRLGTGVWTDGSILTNPTDGTILVDTGALDPGDYLIAVTAAASNAWVYDVQARDAANLTTLHAQRRRPGAGNEDFLGPSTFTMVANQRVRLVLAGTVAGEIQASLWVQPIF